MAPHGVDQDQRGLGQFRGAGLAAAFGHFAIVVLDRGQPVQQGGLCVGKLLGRQLRARVAIAIQEDAGPCGEVAGIGDEGRQCFCIFYVRLRAGRKPGLCRLELADLPCQQAAKIGGDAMSGFASLQPMGAPRRQGQILDAVQQKIELAPVAAQRGIQKLDQPKFAGLGHQMRDGVCQTLIAGPRALQHRLPRGGDHLPCRLVVQDFEGGRDASFQRKARQHDLAEGMQGQDFQPARCFQRAREQSTRRAQISMRLAADVDDALA